MSEPGGRRTSTDVVWLLFGVQDTSFYLTMTMLDRKQQSRQAGRKSVRKGHRLKQAQLEHASDCSTIIGPLVDSFDFSLNN